MINKPWLIIVAIVLIIVGAIFLSSSQKNLFTGNVVKAPSSNSGERNFTQTLVTPSTENTTAQAKEDKPDFSPDPNLEFEGITADYIIPQNDTQVLNNTNTTKRRHHHSSPVITSTVGVPEFNTGAIGLAILGTMLGLVALRRR